MGSRTGLSIPFWRRAPAPTSPARIAVLSNFMRARPATASHLTGRPPTASTSPIYLLWESPSGRIWCGTRGGLFEVLGGGRFRRQPLAGSQPNLVTDLVETAGGKLWVATNDGIYVVSGKDGAVQRIGKEDGLPNNWVNALLLDRAGRLWAGTRDGLVLLRDGGAGGRCGVQRVYTKKDGLPANDVMALAEGPDGAVWMGTAVGISRLIPGTGDAVFQNLTRSQGLTDRQIVALAADPAGNMWAGTEGGGVMKIGSAGFITFREQDGLATDRVFSVFGDRTGTVLAVTQSATQSGRAVAIFDGVNKFRTVGPKVVGDNPGWGQNQILLQSRTGEWWAATHGGLCRFAPTSAAGLEGRRPKACYAPDLSVFRVFEDSKGRIWASGQSGSANRLLRWDPARKTISGLEEGPKGRQLVSAFAEDHDGNIWMGLWGSDGGELFRYDGRHFTAFKFPDGGPATIFALLVDHLGRLWIASDGAGLGLLENPSRAPFHPRMYDTVRGLASNQISALVEDKAGRIYACTGKGRGSFGSHHGPHQAFLRCRRIAAWRNKVGVPRRFRQPLVRHNARLVEAYAHCGAAPYDPIRADYRARNRRPALSGFASRRSAPSAAETRSVAESASGHVCRL